MGVRGEGCGFGVEGFNAGEYSYSKEISELSSQA